MSDDCGCCTPLPARPVDNRPGLSTVAYRLGTYSTFREMMLARIAGTQGLTALSTRASDDYAVTVLELWAAVADVLAFYQERYANEAFLRTATRRQSVARLAALLDYSLGPGVAATVSLAFTLEPGKRVDLPEGLRVASVPAAGELPQTFETVEVLAADARLNRLRVLPAPVPEPALGLLAEEATLDRDRAPELAATLAPGERVLLFDDGRPGRVEEKQLEELRIDGDRVVVRWTEPVQQAGWSASTLAYRARRSFRLFGHAAPPTFVAPVGTAGQAASRVAWTVQQTSFGYPGSSVLTLDARYDGLVAGQALAVVDTAGLARRVFVREVAQAQRSLGPLADTVTELTVTPSVGPFADRRTVIVHELVGEPIGFWDFAYPAVLSGTTVYLPGVRSEAGDGVEVGRAIERGAFKPGEVLRVADLDAGRRLLLADDEGAVVAARVALPPTILPAGAQPGDLCHLAVRVAPEEPLRLDARSAVLVGNVALATHGETIRDEVLGSGDASRGFQRFALRRQPLTFVPSPVPPGAESTVEVTVDGVRWHQAPSLAGHGPTERVYVLRADPDGTSLVQFGDGRTGARLPTGANNVRVTYRVGVGLAGRVRPGTLTAALDRPAGLLGVSNARDAEGGADPETVEQARRSAPRTVRTFGRAVSLRDLEDLVTETGEAAKAQAVAVWDGADHLLHVTVAGQGGAQLGVEALGRLRRALDGARDPAHRLAVAGFRAVPVVVQATVTVDPDHPRERTTAAARDALVVALSSERLGLGRPVRLSEVYAAVQAVPGVVGVDVDTLTYKRPLGMPTALYLAELRERGAVFRPNGTPDPVQPILRIRPARTDPAHPGAVLPAELAWIETPGQDVTIVGAEGIAA